MTLVVGLTGGIAAGKSEALAAFERRGAEVLDTDRVAHELLADPEVSAALVERWGPSVAPDGEIDRAAVASRVFADRSELDWLEGVLHPRVGRHVAAWREGLSGEVEVAVVEIPLLFEAALEGAFDATVAVVATDELREARMAERDHRGGAGRSSRQLTQEQKAERADHVIVNDGSLEKLDRSVGALVSTLLAEEGA